MFTIRVYGLLINEENKILVSDEIIAGSLYTKFCGGGLEYGEGTLDCLKREFREEMNLKIKVLEHFYTVDFYQESKFRNKEQVISVYYFIAALEKIPEYLFRDKLNLEEIQKTEQKQLFRWISKDKFTSDLFSFPIDKVVTEKLIEHLK